MIQLTWIYKLKLSVGYFSLFHLWQADISHIYRSTNIAHFMQMEQSDSYLNVKKKLLNCVSYCQFFIEAWLVTSWEQHQSCSNYWNERKCQQKEMCFQNILSSMIQMILCSYHHISQTMMGNSSIYGFFFLTEWESAAAKVWEKNISCPGIKLVDDSAEAVTCQTWWPLRSAAPPLNLTRWMCLEHAVQRETILKPVKSFFFLFLLFSFPWPAFAGAT